MGVALQSRLLKLANRSSDSLKRASESSFLAMRTLARAVRNSVGSPAGVVISLETTPVARSCTRAALTEAGMREKELCAASRLRVSERP